MESIQASEQSCVLQNYVSCDVVDQSSALSDTALTEEIVKNALRTPKLFVTHSNFDTPGGSVYYIPKVSTYVLLVKGTLYDPVDDCIVAYMKYAAEASVNYYIGDSDAQMLISKMKNRKKYVSDFSFDYLVENDELVVIFWADEISKYNYREFCDVVSFDATFKTRAMLNSPTQSFIKAFEKAPSIVVTDQDGAMRNAIQAEFAGSKHRLCM
ncbi:protein FAR1-related sequence 5 [Tanacetum coccineum]|uniref:Protein FAR1-related sequence 5 n=1 Tax=Tanacetum coccineum TaxID=301880 RepID=A0ABQ5IML3_9ASTR